MRIVATRFGRTVEEVQEEFGKLIEEFVVERDQKGRQLATDQFLNALHLVKHAGVEASFAQLRAVVLQALNDPQA